MEASVQNALENRLVRGCYGGTGKGVSVPTSTSMDGVTDEHCSYNVNQTPNASDTVGSSDQKWYAKGFYGRQGSQDNKHADYLVTDCTEQPRGGELVGDGSPLCNEVEGTDNINGSGEASRNVGNTVTGFTGSIYCHSNYDKSGDAQDHGRLEVVQGAFVERPRGHHGGDRRGDRRDVGASWGCRGRRDRQGPVR